MGGVSWVTAPQVSGLALRAGPTPTLTSKRVPWRPLNPTSTTWGDV